MNYMGYKLQFSTGIHIGQGSLEDVGNMICADTLFSALCCESLECGNTDMLERLVHAVRENRLRISDAFPFHEETWYVPRPKVQLRSENRSESSVLKKTLKKLTYIPTDLFEEYVNGEMDILAEYQKLTAMGKSEFRTMSNVDTEGDTQPFSVGVYHFSPGWGLYVIVGYEDKETLFLIESLLFALGFSGIGGKRSSGLGKYTLTPEKLTDKFENRLCIDGKENRYMLLSGSMADDDELNYVLTESSYLLKKRGGFVASESFSSRPMKKKDSFFFQAGSVFSHTFSGILRDVSSGGNHPVYRYGKPVFMEVL